MLVVRLGGNTGAPQPNPREVVIFTSFIMAGLVPHFFEFFLAILNFYGIHLVHLVPNSIIMLATFAHFCEIFLGITPNLHLFRYFYSLWPHEIRSIIGLCSFRLPGLKDLELYLSLPIRNKWENWTKAWCYIAADDSQDYVRWPEGPAYVQDLRSEKVEITPALRKILEH